MDYKKPEEGKPYKQVRETPVIAESVRLWVGYYDKRINIEKVVDERITYKNEWQLSQPEYGPEHSLWT